jgi:MoaA/NifB/PqqE/SkfB family radical SAM enzyme
MMWQTYHWHLEPSSRCTLECPRCPRTEHRNISWINKDMTLDFVKSFLTLEILKNVHRITLCGDVGDPIYCKELIEICQYFKSTNPKLHLYIITNGSYKKSEWWTKLGVVLNEYDTVNFSVDGYDQDSNDIYRKNNNFASIVEGIKSLRASSSVFINWASIVFKFNQDKLVDMQSFAKSLGCDGFQITKSTKFGSKYGNAYGGESDPLEPIAEWISSSHRYERELINLSGRVIDNREYLALNYQKFLETKQKYKDNPVVPMCEIGNRGLYVNAEGVLFPCSWTSFPYNQLEYEGKIISWGDSFFSQHREKCNLRLRNLDDILSDPIWEKLTASFVDRNKSWVECLQKCSNSLVDNNYAVGFETN